MPTFTEKLVNNWILFRGYTTRKKFWIYIITWSILALIVSGVDNVRGTLSGDSGPFLLPAYIVLTFIPWLRVAIRRGRDAFENEIIGVIAGIVTVIFPALIIVLGLLKSIDGVDRGIWRAKYRK